MILNASRHSMQSHRLNGVWCALHSGSSIQPEPFIKIIKIEKLSSTKRITNLTLYRENENNSKLGKVSSHSSGVLFIFCWLRTQSCKTNNLVSVWIIKRSRIIFRNYWNVKKKKHSMNEDMNRENESTTTTKKYERK